MDEPFQREMQACIDAAGTAGALDEKTAVALAGSFYKNFKTGEVLVRLGAGWSEVMRVSPAGGYDGLALLHPASRSLVIVNRGTEGVESIPDWIQNMGVTLLNAPGPQLDDALDLLTASFAAVGGDQVRQILIVGHSLGGALADAQGAYAASLFAQQGLTCPPVKVVGAASAGFARPAAAVAGRRGLTLDPTAPTFITHYVRREDIVPHHPNRAIFGTDRNIASIYEARGLPPTAPHATGLEWRWLADLLRQHMPALYFQFLDQPDDRHVWYSARTRTYAGRDGRRPNWTPKLRRPAGW